MPIVDRDDRGSQFIVTFKASSHLDRYILWLYLFFGNLSVGTSNASSVIYLDILLACLLMSRVSIVF